MYTKICTDCGKTYKATGPAGKYCTACAETHKELQRRKKKLYAEKRRRERGCKIGRGAPPGNKHPNYKHGKYVSQTQCRKYKELASHTCERCGEDLTDATQYQWVMHHKDRDHSNHDLMNLELLCKRCHQLEHQCQDNLKVQRLSREGVESSDSKRDTS